MKNKSMYGELVIDGGNHPEVNWGYGAPTHLASPFDTKPTNPKDSIGSDKAPLHLWPTTATLLGSMALLDGACKYGRSNYRVMGVRASIYADAAKRHLDKWFEGQDKDGDSGLSHLAHVLACAAILVDAEAAGKLIDDRNVEGGYIALLDEMTALVPVIKAKYVDKTPHHYTIADNF